MHFVLKAIMIPMKKYLNTKKTLSRKIFKVLTA